MANNYFQFKQFTIYQDQCAMKVCTDACVFGAFTARHIESNQLRVQYILDIGTGTGLLSLMLAQKTAAFIDAIEIDTDAFLQSSKNFEASPWNDRLQIFNKDVLHYNDVKKYDCIISNPPFFENDLKSASQQKNAAKHDDTLTLDQLLSITDQYLNPDGFLAVLLPWRRVESFIQMARMKGYFLQEELDLQHTASHPYFRGILIFGKKQTTASVQTVSIKDENGQYTEAFTGLLKDYYLHL